MSEICKPLNIKGTVSRVWIGPCIVSMVSTQQGHVSRRFSDFLMGTSFFNSSYCSCSVLAKNWRLCRQLAAAHAKLLPCGYTHKTSGFKTSGFKTSGFKTSGFKTSGLQNVRFTKRQVSKRLVSKRLVSKRPQR